MTAVATGLMIIGAAVAVLAGVGVLRFDTAYARLHSAGKASPVAFVIAATGAAIELGPSGAAALVIAGSAMIFTLPLGVHLLFRALYRNSDNSHLMVDQLRDGPSDDAAPPS